VFDLEKLYSQISHKIQTKISFMFSFEIKSGIPLIIIIPHHIISKSNHIFSKVSTFSSKISNCFGSKFKLSQIKSH
jgi:hypothetical protein